MGYVKKRGRYQTSEIRNPKSEIPSSFSTSCPLLLLQPSLLCRE